MTHAAAAIVSAPYEDPKMIHEFALESYEAFDLLEHTCQNVFLTGRAGTGKSTFLEYVRAHTEKEVVVLAPTGVAALNVRGQTIRSFFRFKPGFVDIAAIKPNCSRMFQELELLIIDEISMVRADVFDGIDRFLRLARENDKPFGGVQICIIGDLFQLPLVVSIKEKALFAQHYPLPFFFMTKAYEAADFKMAQLNTVHRQNDTAFVQILNAIRTGTCDIAQLEMINSRVKPQATPAPGTLVLTTTSALAQGINNATLAKLLGKTHLYEGALKDAFGMKEGRLPAPEQLSFKVGAQVMFVKNDSKGRWVNGTTGSVEKLCPKAVTVRIENLTHEVEREQWQTIGYEFDESQGKIVEKTLGTYTQFPLILAWAITIHKSQGKTLELVIIDLGNSAFTTGQLYVALSRCKSLSSFVLRQPVTPADIRCDTQVIAFMKGLAP